MEIIFLNNMIIKYKKNLNKILKKVNIIIINLVNDIKIIYNGE